MASVKQVDADWAFYVNFRNSHGFECEPIWSIGEFGLVPHISVHRFVDGMYVVCTDHMLCTAYDAFNDALAAAYEILHNRRKRLGQKCPLMRVLNSPARCW